MARLTLAPVFLVHPGTTQSLYEKALGAIRRKFTANQPEVIMLEWAQSPTDLARTLMQQSGDRRILTLQDTFFRLNNPDETRASSTNWVDWHTGESDNFGLLAFRSASLQRQPQNDDGKFGGKVIGATAEGDGQDPETYPELGIKL